VGDSNQGVLVIPVYTVYMCIHRFRKASVVPSVRPLLPDSAMSFNDIDRW